MNPFSGPGNKVFSIVGHEKGYTCAASDQGVRCWGTNNNYGFGTGEDLTATATPESSTLLPMEGLKALRIPHQYKAFKNHGVVFALFKDGTARCWGSSSSRCGYSLENPTPDHKKPGPNIFSHGGKIKDIRGADEEGFLMLLEDGRVYAWETTAEITGVDYIANLASNQPLDLGGSATAISKGNGFGCAVIDAKVKCWGNPWSGQESGGFTLLTPDLPFVKGFTKPVVDIQSTYYNTCALHNDGTLRCWGHKTAALGYESADYMVGDAAGEMDAALSPDISGVVELSAGHDFFCAKLNTGGAKCWGPQSATACATGYDCTQDTLLPQEELPIGPVDSIHAMEYTTAAIVNGNIRPWGRNDLQQLGYTDHRQGESLVLLEDSANIIEKVYDGILAEKGEGHAKRNQCTQCAQGTEKDAGDSVLNTTICFNICELTEVLQDNKCLCKADYHLIEGECFPCEEGSVNPQGDDREVSANTQCEVCKDYQHYQDHRCVNDTAVQECQLAPEKYFFAGTVGEDDSTCRDPTWIESKVGKGARKPNTRQGIKDLFNSIGEDEEQRNAQKATKRQNFKTIVEYIREELRSLPDRRVKITKESLVLSDKFQQKLGERQEIEFVLPVQKTTEKLANASEACEQKDIDLKEQPEAYDVHLEEGDISLICKGKEPVTKLEKLAEGSASAFQYACFEDGAWQADTAIEHDQDYKCKELSFYVNSLAGITCPVTLPVSQSNLMIVAGSNQDCGESVSEGDTCSTQCNENYVKVSDGICSDTGYQAGVCRCDAPFQEDNYGNCKFCESGKFSQAIVEVSFDGQQYDICSDSVARVSFNGLHNIQEVTQAGYTAYSEAEHIGEQLHGFEEAGAVKMIQGLSTELEQERYFVCTTHPSAKFSVTCSDSSKSNHSRTECAEWSTSAKDCNQVGRLFVPGGDTFDSSCGATCPAGQVPVGSFCNNLDNKMSCNTLSYLYTTADCCQGMANMPQCLHKIQPTTLEQVQSLSGIKREDGAACQEGDKVVYGQDGKFVCEVPAESTA